MNEGARECYGVRGCVTSERVCDERECYHIMRGCVMKGCVVTSVRVPKLSEDVSEGTPTAARVTEIVSAELLHVL